MYLKSHQLALLTFLSVYIDDFHRENEESSSYDSSFIDDDSSSSSSDDDSADSDSSDDYDKKIINRRKAGGEFNLFRDAGKGLVPKGKQVNNNKCKHCTEVAPDMYKCNKLGNKTNHHQCTNCQKNFPERMEYD